MGRFCYCSKILPGKAQVVREHWKNKEINSDSEVNFWNHLKITGFESWLQPTPQGDFLIHYLEGEEIQKIFKGLREEILSDNRIALKLHAFYLDVLGKDYSLPEAEPKIECLLDISLSPQTDVVKKGFFYPLLLHKEQEHRQFRLDSMGRKRGRHEASMQAFGVSHLSVWLQNCGQEKCIVLYGERCRTAPSQLEREKLGKKSPEWQEISKELMEHTGLSYSSLSPDVELLTKSRGVEILDEPFRQEK